LQTEQARSADKIDCGADFHGANIQVMGYDFINEPTQPDPQPASGGGARPPVKGTVIDILDFQEPTPPPPGLMDKRLPFPVWLLIALLLGGLIAAGLFLIGSS
jgi:hypothetical protein